MNYLISECNYGGRVTDDKDRRLIKTILAQFFNTSLLYNDKFLIDPAAEEYCIPNFLNQSQLKEKCRNLPEETSPEILGFHPNA